MDIFLLIMLLNLLLEDILQDDAFFSDFYKSKKLHQLTLGAALGKDSKI